MDDGLGVWTVGDSIAANRSSGVTLCTVKPDDGEEERGRMEGVTDDKEGDEVEDDGCVCVEGREEEEEEEGRDDNVCVEDGDVREACMMSPLLEFFGNNSVLLSKFSSFRLMSSGERIRDSPAGPRNGCPEGSILNHSENARDPASSRN